MGQGGNLLIINNSDFILKRTEVHSYQMNSWDNNFPEKIYPGDVKYVYVEFQNNGAYTQDDAGHVVYRIEGTNDQFQIQAKANDNYMLAVDWKNTMDDVTFFPRKWSTSKIDLGWQHDGVVTLKFPYN